MAGTSQVSNRQIRGQIPRVQHQPRQQLQSLRLSVYTPSGAMAPAGDVCSTCRSVLCPEPGVCSERDPGSVYFTPAGQTLRAFRQASQQGCAVCSTIWNLTERHRHAWSNASRETWEPLRYRVAKYQGEESVVRLNVLYKDPLKSEVDELRFRLIPVDGQYRLFHDNGLFANLIHIKTSSMAHISRRPTSS